MMPVEVRAELQVVNDDSLAELAYELMSVVFQLHNDLGRFCNELAYKRLVAERFAGIDSEVPIVVSYRDFSKTYYIDALVRNSLIVDWKATERLAAQHRGQTLNYLLLCNLHKGFLINAWPESVEHEFVNTTLTLEDRRRFLIDQAEFKPLDDTDRDWWDFLIGAIGDWGTRLDVRLYQDAIAHLFGGNNAVVQNIQIQVDGVPLVQQKARLVGSGAAYRVTTLKENKDRFESHATKFLCHTNLPEIHWVNVIRNEVSIRTLSK